MKNNKSATALLTLLLCGIFIFTGCSLDDILGSYTVTVVAGIQNGSITASPDRGNEGTMVNLTIVPAVNYQLKAGSLTVKRADGTAVTVSNTGNTRTFIMPASDVTVNGEFEAVDTTTVYNVSIADTIQNGAITANPTSSAAGSTITLTIAPTTGFQLKDGTLTVKRTDGSPVTVSGTGNTRTFTMPPSNVTVNGEFEAVDTTTTYNVTIADTIQNGAITANPASAAAGSTITLTIAPTTGFQLKDGTLTVKRTDGSPVTVSGAGNTRTFTMPPSNVTMNGEFEAVDTTTVYDVSIATDIQNGTISANPVSAAEGTSVTLSITPNDGFQFKDGTLTVKQTNGILVTVSDTGTFTMPASDVTVNGEFEAVDTTTVYNVSIAIGIQNGTITANPASAAEGTSVTLSITPNDGFQFKDGTLTVKQTNGIPVTVSDTGTFTMPPSHVTVNGEFEAVSQTTNYNVTIADTIQNGAITANPTSAAAGTSVTLTITPNTSFQLKDGTLTVKQTDGTAITVSGEGNSRTFTIPASDVTVNGEFEKSNTVSSAIEFSGFGDETIDLTMDSEGDIPLGRSLQITVTGEYASYDWFVDGSHYNSGSNQLSVYSSNLRLGLHSIAVAVAKDGIPYSKELTFTVVR